MHSSSKITAWFWFLIFSLLFSAQVVPRIFNDSPTDDEPMDITDGYFCWKGDVLSNGTHPVFLKMLQTLPMQFMNLKDSVDLDMGQNQLQIDDSFFILNKAWFNNEIRLERFKTYISINNNQCQRRAYDFLFVLNKDRFEEILRHGRFITFLFSLGIGLLLFFKTRQNYPVVFISALALWAFEPTLSAFSAQCGSDVPATFFFFAAVLAFQKHLENPGPKWSLIAGILLGAAACSKFSTLFLMPGFLILEIIHYFQFRHTKSLTQILKIMRDWVWALMAFVTFISITYLPGTIFEKHHWMPFIYFWLNLASVMSIFYFHHPTYFLGQASYLNHWLYFPIAFTLKSTLPFLILTLGVIGEGLRKKNYPSWLWLPPFLFFLFILPVQNLGIRYLLPIYPFLILMACFLIDKLWNWKPSQGKQIGKMIVIGLLLWHMASVSASAPNMISYYNDLVPWKKKVYYLGDSNVDMGQDVKRLAETAKKRNWKNIKLAQFGGSVEPSFYGMYWNPWTQKDLMNPQPGTVYAINVLLFQLGPIFVPSLTPISGGWASTTQPTGRVGDTWIYFEIPGTPVKDQSSALESVKIF
jgi:hypothetical protein